MRKWRSRAENQSSVPLFDWHDRPFVPTCPHVEHRAQRQARLARQGHRRRRLGLAGGRKLRSLPIVPKAVLPSNAAEKAPRQLISGRPP
jgi:hypothetical protein